MVELHLAFNTLLLEMRLLITIRGVFQSNLTVDHASTLIDQISTVSLVRRSKRFPLGDLRETCQYICRKSRIKTYHVAP